MDEDNAPPYVVIGIDFGTTYSGVSWTWSGDPKTPNIIAAWDADYTHDTDSEKVPSCIEYDKNGKVTAWGFRHDPRSRIQLQWFKLLLSEEAQEEGSDKIREAEQQLNDLNKLAVDVVADYLLCLWGHTLVVLEKKLTAVTLKTLLFRVVITVPAAWDHNAQVLMYEAALRAGIREPRSCGLTTLQLVAEPEAAALATFGDAGLHHRPDLKLGDVFVVCDAGGGTVDLISYQIKDLEPLRLEMCVEATSGFSGTVYLDEAFERQIRTIMGASAYDKIKPESKAKFLNDDWEHHIKRNYREGARDLKVYVPGYARKRSSILPLRSQPVEYINLEPGHLNTIFRPVCNQIMDLVNIQVRAVQTVTTADPKTIILVGGFGANRFLCEQLEKTFKNIPIQQPVRAWSAISRGAVLKGLSKGVDDETVTNFISNYHYGVVCEQVFNGSVHHTRDKFFCKMERVWKARDQMRWYLHRGVNVHKRDPVRHSWYQKVTHKRQLKSIPLDIYISDSNEAPSRKDEKVKLLCRIDTNFDEEIYDQLPLTGSEGHGGFRKLQFTLEMKVSAGNLSWLVYWGDTERGRARIHVNYNNVRQRTRRR